MGYRRPYPVLAGCDGALRCRRIGSERVKLTISAGLASAGLNQIDGKVVARWLYAVIYGQRWPSAVLEAYKQPFRPHFQRPSFCRLIIKLVPLLIALASGEIPLNRTTRQPDKGLRPAVRLCVFFAYND